MWRVLLEAALLFGAPFAAYAAYVALRRRYPFAVDYWTRGAVSNLVLAGLAAAVGGALLLGVLAPRRQGAYVPAHIENGQLAPGRLE
ncbi:DUF6111 family protein [Methylocella sp.]|uniref:DUF6111 family protein n=1 Tax=Methylocella sp. TaxID=1978226 RepID=UPI0035B44725